MAEEVTYADIKFSKIPAGGTGAPNSTATSPPPEHKAVEHTSQSRVTIALGVTVGVLLLAVIVMGTAIGLQVRHNHSNSQSMNSPCLENYNDVITRELSKYKKGLRQRLCGDPNTGKEVESCAVCLDGWRKGYNGSCYFLSTERKSWDFANESCSKLGAHLAVIENEEELDTIHRAITGYSYNGLDCVEKILTGFGLMALSLMRRFQFPDNTNRIIVPLCMEVMYMQSRVTEIIPGSVSRMLCASE
ncbi:C-type lectin domain family 4 member A-like isoform X2 [Polyodon spathula]|uniref:C-type lectin domain family 4 member A-like isoform X2 n=1 Tax=Polyodon spathula TaxID=7913 RepID=UPI001B7ED567|nr:C-type lectin domain family 4 member A-like isoform X2 [Polyodon spathula]